jgi:hypothetical protein
MRAPCRRRGRDRRGTLLLVLALGGCVGDGANQTNSQPGPAAPPATGATTDPGSRMLGHGDPIGGVSVETPPLGGAPAPVAGPAQGALPDGPPPPLVRRVHPPPPPPPVWRGRGG